MSSKKGGLNRRIPVYIRNSTKPGIASVNTLYKPTVGGTQSSDKTFDFVEQVHWSKGAKTPNGVKHRKALPYDCFVARVLNFSFGYQEFTNNAKTSYYQRTGKTDMAGIYGLQNGYLYLGTKLSGGRRLPTVPPNLLNRVKTEVLLKLQDQHLDLSASLAEAGKTVTELSALVRKVALSLVQFKRGNFVNALRILTGSKPHKSLNKDPSGAWLQYQYGLMPIMSDVKGLISALDAGLKDEGSYVSATSSMLASGILPIPGGDWYMLNVRGYLRYGAVASVYARIDDPYLEALSGLTSLNPLTVAWELLPFSFVVDWFFPIGNFLQALTATVGLRFIDGYVGHKSTLHYEFEGIQRRYFYGSLGEGATPPSCIVDNVCMFREVMVAFPTPGLYVKSPFSASHAVSAFALLSSLRR